MVVLGMHRSGTSALSGVLSILGAAPPNSLMPATDSNAKGYFESSAIYELHQELLTEAGSRWDDWLPITPTWFDSTSAVTFRERAAETVTQEFGSSQLFVLKDPRICRLLPFWDQVLQDLSVEPYYVLSLRHPFEVANSLHRRYLFDCNLGLLIWLRHVLQAEADSRGKTRCFTTYSELLTNWGHVVERIQSELDLTLPRMSLNVVSEIEEFLSTGLRSFAEDSAVLLTNPLVSDWVRDTYAILVRWASEGEDPKDYPRLDTIREAFNAAAPLFFGVVQAGRDSAYQAMEAGSQITQLTQERDKVQSDLDSLTAEKEALQKTADDFSSEIETQRRTVQLRDQELAQSKRAAEEAGAALSVREQELETARSRLEDRRHELEQLLSAQEQRKHELEQLRNVLEQRTQELAQLNARQAKEAQRFDDKRIEMAALVEALKAENTDYIARLEDAKTSLRAREEQLKNKDAEIAFALAQNEAKLCNQESRFKNQSQELARLTRLLMDSEHALQTKTKDLEEKSKASLKAAQERAERAEYAVMAVQSSNTWKLMAPLRVVSSILRRNKG